MVAAGVAASLTLASQALAQYPGDAFFSNLSPSVAPGEDVVVQLEVFCGSDPFGAARVVIEYDESQFSIPEIREVANTTWSEKSYAVEEAGRLSLMVFNDSSLTEPSGTVKLVELVIRPKLPAGETGSVSIAEVETLDSSKSPYSSSSGFDMTVSVVDNVVTTLSKGFLAASSLAAVQATPSQEIQRVPVTDLDFKVRPGARIRLWSSKIDDKGRRIWSAPEVQTYDPEAPSD
jgi:hypothetical protein